MSRATGRATRRLPRRAAVLAIFAGAALAGCGGGGGETTQANRTTPSPPRVIVETGGKGFNAVRVYREAAPGVVTIRSIFGSGGGGLLAGPSAAEGSGFVLSHEGEVVTNAHVVTTGSGGRQKAKQVFVEFPDRNIVSAHIVGVDPFSDVALLKVDPSGLHLHPLDLGNDGNLVVGQPVATLGSPFGEQLSFSVGIVSATDRSVRSLTQFQIEGAIQTDAAINPGNSGGPLLDAGARVIGISEQIDTRTGVNQRVGFAVPISAVKRSLAQLRQNGKAEYAYIGVSSQALYPQLAHRLGLDVNFGSLIAEVVPGTPADDAGLRGGKRRIRFQAATYRIGGDVILAVDGHRVVRPDDLSRLIASHAPGDEVKLEILRDGERKEVHTTLGVRPNTVSSG